MWHTFSKEDMKNGQRGGHRSTSSSKNCWSGASSATLKFPPSALIEVEAWILPGLALVLALFVQVQNLPKFLASSNISSKHHRVRCSKCEPAFATIHTANRWYSRHSPLQFRFFNACIDGFQRHNEVYRIVISKCCVLFILVRVLSPREVCPVCVAVWGPTGGRDSPRPIHEFYFY